MKCSLTALGLALAVSVAFADDGSLRDKIVGAWLTEGSVDSGAASWVLERDGDTIHVTELQNGEKQSEFKCNTKGRECDAKDSGRPAKVSFWFNGPKLVQMETRGSEVFKRRFSASNGGEALEVEVIPIVPQGKAVVLRFKRAQPSTSAQ
jgi:hypothetical protein